MESMPYMESYSGPVSDEEAVSDEETVSDEEAISDEETERNRVFKEMEEAVSRYRSSRDSSISPQPPPRPEDCN